MTDKKYKEFTNTETWLVNVDIMNNKALTDLFTSDQFDSITFRLI